ncbi:MAG: helix-turn-helix transcriptional regulator, partial [Candidatus Limnocylindrales bacterium]
TGAGGADVPARIAVTIEGSSPMDRMEMYALAHGLTPRERELVTLLGTGVGTSELAGRLFVSEHTVQDHLKAIFSRTQVHSRRELLSRALGVTEPPTRASDP